MMNPATLQSMLRQLFVQHEVDLDLDEDWLVTDGDFPAIRAIWHDGSEDGPSRLDIDVVLSEERRIEESFAGAGTGEAACRDALQRFAATDLHVLLAACWYVTDDRKLDVATWQIGARTWDAFLGHFVMESADIEVPAAAAATVAQALRDETLAAQPHWLRLLLRRTADGAVAVECLLDNQPWPAGDRALASAEWPISAPAYGVRAFWMLDVRDY